MIVAALIWALCASGGGIGSGGSGNGSGFLNGDGSGTGLRGDGPGAGGVGDGTGGGAKVAQAHDSPASGSPTHASATSSPATSEAPEDDLAIAAMKSVPRQVAPIVPASAPFQPGEPGAEGATGGGGFGPGHGKDPGARGDVSFTLTWTYSVDRQGIKGHGGPDIDIWVKDPIGQVINTSQEGQFKQGPTPEGGRADFDDRGAYGDGNGGGPERIFWPTDKAPKGQYTYGVRWFQGIGSVKYTVKVYRGQGKVPEMVKTGTLIDTDKGENKELGEVTVK